MTTIKYTRRAVCLADDARSRNCTVEMPDGATLAELVGVLLRGGNGNTWPIPTWPTPGHGGWLIYSNIGRIAAVSGDGESVEYCGADGSAKISTLGIEWVFGAREREDLSVAEIAWRFEK